MAGVLLILTVAFLPETLRKQRQVEVIKNEMDEGLEGNHFVSKDVTTVEKKPSGPSFFTTLGTSFKPMIVMLHDPTVLLLTAYNTVIFASLYFLVRQPIQKRSIFGMTNLSITIESHHHGYIQENLWLHRMESRSLLSFNGRWIYDWIRSQWPTLGLCAC